MKLFNPYDNLVIEKNLLILIWTLLIPLPRLHRAGLINTINNKKVNRNVAITKHIAGKSNKLNTFIVYLIHKTLCLV